ncbi:MAG: hypothetical protein JWM44_1186 [Bacilli bacterium]|nr:hypothetical protein [Bacilli bacterium]
MDFKFNFNDTVKVRLTELGIILERRKHDGLRESLKNISNHDIGDYVTTIDAEGYTSYEIWQLMYTFGKYMVMGSEEPFHGDMIITNGEPIVKMDDVKAKWLKRNGYLPVTDAIIREWMQWFYTNPFLPERVEEQRLIYKAKFSYYKRFDKKIVLYTSHHIETKSINEIKQGARKMYRQHVLLELWPIKQIHRIYTRWQLGYYGANGKP